MKKSRQKTDYWVLKLHLSTLGLILRRGRWNPVGRLTYLESTLFANLLLGILVKFKLISFSLHKIQPRAGVAGPILHLSDVRDDKDRIITLDIYRAILKIRRWILDDLVKGFKSYAFLKEKASIPMFHAWLGLKIADEISPLIYLVFFGRWKYRGRDMPERRRNTLILSDSEWNSYLIEFIKNEKLMDEIDVRGNRKWRIEQWIFVGAYLVQSVLCFIPKKANIAKPNSLSPNQQLKKILVDYSFGVDKKKRNDIPFVQTDQFDLKRIVFFFHKPNLSPSRSELLWFSNNKISCISGPFFRDNIQGIKRWRSSPLRKKEKKSFCRIYLRMLFLIMSSQNPHSAWLLKKLWIMGMNLAYWQDLLLTNQIGLVLHSRPSAKNFIISLAISECGGIAVYAEHSILFDYCTYIHNSPSHVRFVTGPYSVEQIPEPSFSLYTLLCGAFNVFENNLVKRSIQKQKGEEQILLTVFDEIPNDVFFGDSVEQFYRAILDLVSEESRICLLIKTKKPRVFEKLSNIKKEIERLTEKQKSFLLDWRVTVAAASAQSDLSVSLPSTAAFESVICGNPTLVFNPMRTGSRIFYRKNGLGRRIFEDRESLVMAIKKFTEGERNNIGECSDIIPLLDPFQDGRGAHRVGQYILKCLEGYDKGWKREKILKNVNRIYGQKWGENKIICEFLK